MIKEVTDPVPGPGEVLLDVAVAGIQSLDGYLRRGRWQEFLPSPPPYAPGPEAAGVIAAVGDGVEDGWLGRRVVAGLTGGGYASRVVAAVDALSPVPDGLALDQAMALLHDGSTAQALLEATPVDVVFDGVSGDLGRGAFGLVRPGGRYANYGNASGAETFVTPDEAAARRIRHLGMEQLGTFPADRPRRIAQVLELAAAGELRPVIGRVYPLDQAVEAHRAIEAREVPGKILFSLS